MILTSTQRIMFFTELYKNNKEMVVLYKNGYYCH